MGICLIWPHLFQCLRRLDTVYHGALGLVTGCTMLTHRHSLYTKANSLSRRRHTHWLTFIFKSQCTSLLSVHFHFPQHILRSSDLHLTSVPKHQTELGTMALCSLFLELTASWTEAGKTDYCWWISKKMMKDFGSCLCFWIFPFIRHSPDILWCLKLYV